MKTITSILLRQLTLMLMCFAFLYFAVLFFGAEPNYFIWNESEKAVMGLFVLLSSVILHAYWYDQKKS